MGCRANAAEPLGKGPGITRVTVFQDDFDATPGGAAGEGVLHLPGGFVHGDFHP